MSIDQLKIACPKCSWEPDGASHWACSCGHIWDTFETQGVCPSCNKQWKHTQCPTCEGWSVHDDWYIISIDMNSLFEATAGTGTSGK